MHNPLCGAIAWRRPLLLLTDAGCFPADVGNSPSGLLERQPLDNLFQPLWYRSSLSGVGSGGSHEAGKAMCAILRNPTPQGSQGYMMVCGDMAKRDVVFKKGTKQAVALKRLRALSFLRGGQFQGRGGCGRHS